MNLDSWFCMLMLSVDIISFSSLVQSASSALYKCVKENDTSLFAELLYRRGKEADINHQDKVHTASQCLSLLLAFITESFSCNIL